MGQREYPASFQAWIDSISPVIRSSPVWPSIMYQKSLFLYELCWLDCDAWMSDVRGRTVAEQIIRSCGSISANIEEGYGRGFGRDYARFLSYALASARETQGWYHRCHHLIKPDALDHRLALCDEIIAMLLTAVKAQRNTRK